MELTSYDKVKGFSPMIREVIRTQRMPPQPVSDVLAAPNDRAEIAR